MQDNLKIMIDYLTITSKVHDDAQLMGLLGMDDAVWSECNGRHGYPKGWVYDHITILYGSDKPEMGVCLEMSGQGCRRFEDESNIDYDDLFRLVRHNDGFMNITRLDIACDDTGGYLPMDVIAEKVLAGEYVSRSTSWEVKKTNKGTSIYHGSSQSDFRINIYDKARERGFDDGRHWIRCEIRMRRDNAKNAAMKLLDGHSVGDLYAGVLLNYLRYVDMTHSRLKNCKTCDWWDRFIGTTEKISIYEKPGVEYNLSKLERYVFGQAGGSIDTLIDMYGILEFKIRLKDHLKSRHYTLKEKHKKLIRDYGTHDERLHRFRSKKNTLPAGEKDRRYSTRRLQE